MVKLIRNCLERLKVIYDNDGDEIKWELIQSLIKLQISYNINLGNNLTRKHAEFHNNKKNVKTAVQTISNSTSLSIEFMDKILGIPEFSNSDATVHFLRTFNNRFDILNAKLKHTDQKYKRTFSKNTFNQFSAYFKTAGDYIRGLKMIEDKVAVPLLKSKSYVPFFGFLNNMTIENKIQYNSIYFYFYFLFSTFYYFFLLKTFLQFFDLQ